MTQLVTVSTHDELYMAEMDKGVLEDAGIHVHFLNWETVGTAFHLANAIGGVKVQVAENDAQRALELLIEWQNRPIDEEELAREALAARTEDEEIAIQAAKQEESDRVAGKSESERDQLASKAMWYTLGGLVFLPLYFAGMSYLLRAAFRSGELSEGGRISLQVAAVIGAVISFIVILFITGTIQVQ